MSLTGQNDLFGLAAEVDEDSDSEAYSTSVEPWSEKERLDAEKITLGLYLTGHPIKQYEDELKFIRHANIASLLADAERSKSKMEARVAGLVVEMRTRQTKKGTMMGFATLDDRSGELEVAAFSKTYEKFRDILVKDALLVVEGALSIDDFSGGLRLTADKIYSFEDAREAFARGVVLYWKKDKDGESIVFTDTIKKILQPYTGGNCPIQVSYSTEKAVASLQLGDEWRVHPTDELIVRLKKLFPADSVLVKYR
jgi:DNA polymerase-3 subunit alpha